MGEVDDTCSTHDETRYSIKKNFVENLKWRDRFKHLGPGEI
jgi:hypothetical protein